MSVSGRKCEKGSITGFVLLWGLWGIELRRQESSEVNVVISSVIDFGSREARTQAICIHSSNPCVCVHAHACACALPHQCVCVCVLPHHPGGLCPLRDCCVSFMQMQPEIFILAKKTLRLMWFLVTGLLNEVKFKTRIGKKYAFSSGVRH